MFTAKIDDMKAPTFHEFLRIFSAKSYVELFEKLQVYAQMKQKKAALFLRDVLYFYKIITGVPEEERKNIQVPIDRVITRTISSIYGLEFKTPTVAFQQINEIAKRIFPQELLLL